MNLFKSEDVTETRTVVVGTKITASDDTMEVVSYLADILFYNVSKEAFECNHCSVGDFEFGAVSEQMDGVFAKALEHAAEHHYKEN